MKKIISIIIIVFTISGLYSCKDFLDVVPDNVATIDNAFTNKADAERYLFTCYSYTPREPDVYGNPAMFAGDEFWIYWPLVGGGHVNSDPIMIARGQQNASSPYMNYWSGERGGIALFKGIRDCNIFLENIDKAADLDEVKRARWIAEVKFLKAYYHFYLLRMYGPIPTIDKNLPITAESSEVRVHRDPFDKTVDYIVGLIDEAVADLPLTIQNKTSELGRITKPIAQAIKAKVLVTAASPLFNGNADFAGLKGVDGNPLISSVFDAQKWVRAATACKEAITTCEAAGNKLYKFNTSLVSLNDTLALEMSIRNSVCEKWNAEIIWGSTNGSTEDLQRQCMARVDPTRLINEQVYGQMAAPLKIVEMFYTQNGVPITEDISWDAANMYKVQTATNLQKNYLQPGYETAGLNLNREPRFYADLAFDGSKWLMQNGTWNIQAKYGQAQARKSANIYSITGYFTKKLVNWKFEIKEGQDISLENYTWPIIRLADLYLLYAEALNEAQGPTAPDVLTYLNKIRARAGLNTVEVSWTSYSKNPTKYTTKDGMREIIRQERSIEMAFEGSRFWDLRRWKEALVKLNEPIYGWDITEASSFNYYKRKLLFTQSFVAPRDYLWPIKTDEVITNRNVLQNPGW